MTRCCNQFVAVVPAAGVGKRMNTNSPKQYLSIQDKTILEHTVSKLLSHELIFHVVISISEGDEYFQETSLADNPNVSVAFGGKERVDSVLAGLKSINSDNYPWALVHDAARPCVNLSDISQLIKQTQQQQSGGLLAMPVRDTMKKSQSQSTNQKIIPTVEQTVDRENLWHALTPQLYKTNELIDAITQAQKNKVVITDESSAMEYAGYTSILVEGRGDNIKITRPDDLVLAHFILSQQLHSSENKIKAI